MLDALIVYGAHLQNELSFDITSVPSLSVFRQRQSRLFCFVAHITTYSSDSNC